jgi:pimeloyl-ACP methyl ester carboxylesterase
MKKKILSTMAAAIIALTLLLHTNSTHAQVAVKNVVLVHGAFADGSGWELVYSQLKKRGYNVSVVGNPNTSLANDAAATKLVLDRQNGPAVLVGHSYGGAIITEAGNHPNVVGLVYIAAFVPDANETLLKLLQSGPPAPNSGILPPKDGYVWYDVAKYHSGFCADLPKDKAAFMADSQIPVSAVSFGESIANPAWKTKPSWYVVATEDQTIPPDGQRFMAKRAGATVTELKSSHVAFMSKPKEVTDVIVAAAKAVSK